LLVFTTPLKILFDKIRAFSFARTKIAFGIVSGIPAETIPCSFALEASPLPPVLPG
jgi:hypothetical protein